MTLRPDWQDRFLREVCEHVPNCDPTRSPENEFEYVDIGAVDNVTGRIGVTKKFLGRDAPSRARRPIQPGDVLFSNVRTYLKNIARVTDSVSANLCSTGFTVLRPGSKLDSRYLYHYVRSDAFVTAVTPEQTGTHYPATSDRVVLGQAIALPPTIEEQGRIATKLDQIATYLDDTRARLETIPTILKRFRMSVLAAACSGKLTDAWRERPDYSELVGLCAVPSTWARSTLGNLLEPDRGICYGVIKLGADCSDGIPCLRTSDVKPLGIDLSDVKKISREIADQYKRTYLKGGEVLVNVRGTLGGVAVVPSTLAGWNVSREVAVVPVDRQRISPEFASYWVASPYAQAWLTDVAKGAAYTGINLSDLRLLPIAIPELDEQAEIVRRVRALLAQADDIEVRYQKARAFTERLMPSVLAKAFKGELCS